MKKVTLRDIGERCGVTPTLVSAVLNHRKGNISCQPAMRTKIEQVAAELGYRPNLLARSLKNGRTHIIGLITSSMHNEINTIEIITLVNGLLKHGYTTQIVYDRGEVELCRQACESLIDRGCEALIISSELEPEELAMLPHGSTPMYYISGTHQELSPGHTVFLDTRNGCQEAALELEHLGHQNFIFVSGTWDKVYQDPRYCFFMEHCAELGYSGHERFLLLKTLEELTPTVLKPYLERFPETTAIICSNDLFAMKTIQVLDDMNYRCPADFSVVGFDDIRSASLFVPSLSSIHQPVEEAASEIIKMVLNDLEGKKLALSPRTPCHLIVRKSLGPARQYDLSF